MVLHRGGRCTGCFRYRRMRWHPGGRYCQCGGRRWRHRDRGHGHSRSSHGRSCAPLHRASAPGISRRRRFIILAEPQRHRDDGHEDQQSADHQQQKVPHLLHALPLPAQGAPTCGHHIHSWGPMHQPCVRHPLPWERHGQPGMTLASTSRLHLPQADRRTAGPNGAPPIGVVLQQVNTYRRNHLPSGASPERGCPPQTEASSQAPANKKRPTRRRFSSGTDHGCREPITSSSWVQPSSPSGDLPGGASIRPGRFPRCRCGPVPAGECQTPGGPSHGRGSAG